MSNNKHVSKIYILVSYCAPISLRSVCLARVLMAVHVQNQVLSLAENRKAKAHARLTAKLKYFHGFLTFTDGEYTCEM